LLLAVGVVSLLTVAVVGFMTLSNEAAQQSRARATFDGIEQAKAFILDFARKNSTLPPVATYLANTANLTDGYGRRIHYFPSEDLVTGDVCAENATDVALAQCGSDAACATPTITTNLAFVLVSSGNYVKSIADPIHQTSPYPSSTAIPPPSVSFKQYATGLDVGPFANPAGLTDRGPYDDRAIPVSLPNLKEVVGCLSKSQGDVQRSGGVLKLLNVGTALPPSACQQIYNKKLFAYGRTGTYGWSVTGLPTGLTYSSSGSTSMITGTPLVEGSYTVTATVTDSGGKTTSRSYSLAVTSTWTNEGASSETSCSASGTVTNQTQRNSCTGATRVVSTPSACCNWDDTGVTQSLSCGSGYTGSIEQKQQLHSCNGTTQWITTVSNCLPLSTVGGRFTDLAALFPPGDFDSGQKSLTIGSGTGSITISATGNITRHSITSLTSAVGVAGGGTNALDGGQQINFDFGGYGRQLGIELRGLQTDNLGSADVREEASVVFINTVTGMTVGTYTLNACVTGATGASRFSLPDVGAPFNRVEVIANTSPTDTDFYVRGLALCDQSATSCWPSGTTATQCAYP
jgi:hypothetical protein